MSVTTKARKNSRVFIYNYATDSHVTDHDLQILKDAGVEVLPQDDGACNVIILAHGHKQQEVEPAHAHRVYATANCKQADGVERDELAHKFVSASRGPGAVLLGVQGSLPFAADSPYITAEFGDSFISDTIRYYANNMV